jgi:DNA-binding XRE family transcriptional regulator
MSVVHNRIAVFRAEMSMSRKDLADLVGVNPQTIGYLERGDYAPSVELALKLAAVFKAPVDLRAPRKNKAQVVKPKASNTVSISTVHP